MLKLALPIIAKHLFDISLSIDRLTCGRVMSKMHVRTTVDNSFTGADTYSKFTEQSNG